MRRELEGSMVFDISILLGLMVKIFKNLLEGGRTWLKSPER
jgi:hypothetical protein